MTEFYTGKKKAFAFMEQSIKKAGSKGVNKLLLLYETTLTYAISEKKVKERIDLMIETGKVELKNNVLLWCWLK